MLINVFIWDKHASQTGMGFLFGSLACAYFYKQAPLRAVQSYAAVPAVQSYEAVPDAIKGASF